MFLHLYSGRKKALSRCQRVSSTQWQIYKAFHTDMPLGAAAAQEVILAGPVVPDDVQQGTYTWSGKWCFRSNKNRSSAFSYSMQLSVRDETRGENDLDAPSEKGLTLRTQSQALRVHPRLLQSCLTQDPQQDCVGNRKNTAVIQGQTNPYYAWGDELPADAHCMGSFVTYGAEGMQTSVNETFQLLLGKPEAGKAQIDVQGVGYNVYGRFNIKGHIAREPDAGQTLHMLCSKAYIEGHAEFRRRKQQQKIAVAPVTAEEAGIRRLSKRMTLGVRKTSLFFDDEPIRGLPVTATFASSTAGKLLRIVRIQGRSEKRLAFRRWETNAKIVRRPCVKAACSEESDADSQASLLSSDQELADEESAVRAPKEKLMLPGEDNGWVTALMDQDGDVYEGEVADGCRHGVGVHVFANGMVYQGDWRRGREHGTGKLFSPGGAVIYDGDWAEGKMNGKGTYTFASGGIYVGEWRENVRHGRGTYQLPDGGYYDGEWREDFRWGYGKYTWPSAETYEGEWVRGKRQGRGLFVCAAFEYHGQWLENRIDGKGACKYSDGQYYEGMWRQGRKDGRGTLTFSGGANYEGRFKDDLPDGQGMMEILEPMAGGANGEWLIPIDLSCDIWRAHKLAGFGAEGH